MKYYQVKPESDNEYLHGKKDILVGKELYTENQISKMKLTLDYIAKHFLPLQVSSKQTHYFFGARFLNRDSSPKYY